MSPEGHKKQAEELIRQANLAVQTYGVYDSDQVTYLIKVAKVHALLAQVPEEKYDGSLESL